MWFSFHPSNSSFQKPDQTASAKPKQSLSFAQTTLSESPFYLLPSPISKPTPRTPQNATLPPLPPPETNRLPPRIPTTNKIRTPLLRHHQPKINPQHTHLRRRLLATLHPPTPSQSLPPRPFTRRSRPPTARLFPVLIPEVRRRQVLFSSPGLGDHARELLREE